MEWTVCARDAHCCDLLFFIAGGCRFSRESLFVFKGHAKAVSYVKFLSGDELVSASTDSTLKLWSTTDKECKRTFSGHTNEKNFVGLRFEHSFACSAFQAQEL